MGEYEKKTRPRKKRRPNTPSQQIFFKTTYFITRRKVVRENFTDIIDFPKNIIDEDILKHLV